MQDPFHRYKSWDDVPEKMPAKKKKKKKSSAQNRSTVKAKSGSKRISAKVSFAIVSVSLFGLLFSGVVLLYPDLEVNDLFKIKLSVPSGFAQESPLKETDQADESMVVDSEMLDSESAKLSMENTSLNKALEKKRKELEKRERGLEKLAENLEEKKVEIDKQLKEMMSLRREISSALDKKVVANQDSLKKLVEVYSNMKPVNAANILSSINEDLAVKVLGKMKKQNAAAILNYISPKKAQKLSEKYAGLKK